MKFFRFVILAIAASALIAGCGNSGVGKSAAANGGAAKSAPAASSASLSQATVSSTAVPSPGDVVSSSDKSILSREFKTHAIFLGDAAQTAVFFAPGGQIADPNNAWNDCQWISKDYTVYVEGGWNTNADVVPRSPGDDGGCATVASWVQNVAGFLPYIGPNPVNALFHIDCSGDMSTSADDHWNVDTALTPQYLDSSDKAQADALCRLGEAGN